MTSRKASKLVELSDEEIFSMFENFRSSSSGFNAEEEKSGEDEDELFQDEFFECDHDLQRLIFKWSTCLNGKLNYLEI